MNIRLDYSKTSSNSMAEPVTVNVMINDKHSGQLNMKNGEFLKLLNLLSKAPFDPASGIHNVESCLIS